MTELFFHMYASVKDYQKRKNVGQDMVLVIVDWILKCGRGTQKD